MDAEVRTAYQDVPWLERKLSGWLILRSLKRYGPRGAVGLARMRAIQGWIVILVVPVVILSVAFGPPDAFWVLVVFLAGIGGILAFGRRMATEGKKRRSKHDIE